MLTRRCASVCLLVVALLVCLKAQAVTQYTITDLGTLGGAESQACRINASGQVAGYSAVSATCGRAFLWENGAITDLGTLGGPESGAYGINTSGQVVGVADAVSGYQAFLWDSGVMYDLSHLIPDGSGWDLQRARDINDLGQIVGYGEHEGQTRAFLLTPVPEPATVALAAVGVAVLVRRASCRRRG